MKTEKIFYIYFHDPRFIPIHVLEIITEMRNRGSEVHVFTCINGDDVKRKLSANRIIIHRFWTIKARFVPELIFMVLLFPYLFIQTIIRNPDFFYTRHSASSFIAALIAKLFRKPCLIEVNDILLDKLKFSNISMVKTFWTHGYHYINFRLADYLLPVTAQIGSWIKDQYKVKPTKVAVIPNGVNTRRFSPKPRQEARKRYQIPLDSRVVLSLGSLFPWAGLETLIAAAPKVLETYPNTLFLVGSGEEPYVSHLKRNVCQFGLGKSFQFFGFIPLDEASWFISTSDICISPFIFKDVRSGISSLRVFAYLACARPVIGSDITGLGDMLESEDLGVSFPMGNDIALSEAIIALLSNPHRLSEMAKKARKYVVRNYSWEAIVDKLNDVLRGKYIQL